MYRAKEEFYSTHGIDRRAQAEALRSMCKLYKKILKINITRDSYEIISMDPKEKIDSMGFSGKISEWFRDFGCSGQVHKDDLENYLRNTSIDYLRDTFSRGRMSVCIPYRRRTDFGFTSCIMEILPRVSYACSPSFGIILRDQSDSFPLRKGFIRTLPARSFLPLSMHFFPF